MAVVNKDFVVKNGIQVGGLTTLGSPNAAGSLAFPSTGSDATSPSAGHLWRNGNDLKFYDGAATKTLAYTDSTMTGTWEGSVIDPTYGGTGVDNGASTLTLGGDVEFSGAYDVTLTSGANTTLTLPATGTVAVVEDKLSAFAATSSSELAGVISDETGSGTLVFNTSPTFDTGFDSSAVFTAFTSSTELYLADTYDPQYISIGGYSTGTSQYDFGTGATANGETKTINIGTGGVSGSVTDIYLGSSAGGTVNVNKNLVVDGDLTVHGTTTTVESETLLVKDKNIELAVPTAPDTPSDMGASGGGIILKGDTDKTIIWNNDTWTFSENVDIYDGKVYKIDGGEVLSYQKLSLAGAKVEAPNSATSVTSGSAASVASFSATSFRSAKFLVQLTQETDYMVTEILVIHDGTDAHITEYGRIQTGSTIDASFSADISSGNLHLYVTSTSASGGSPLSVRHTVEALVA